MEEFEGITFARIEYLAYLVVEWFKDSESTNDVYELGGPWDELVQGVLYDFVEKEIKDNETKIEYWWDDDFLHVYKR